MAGREIVRAADLVFIGTTSLYGQSPSQYDRIAFPCGRVVPGSAELLRYDYLGRTLGVGTFQFGEQTVVEMAPCWPSRSAASKSTASSARASTRG